MNLEDLKLLVDVAWHERHGQKGFTVGSGFGRACTRLVARGLLIRNPTQRKNAQVTLTSTGETLLNKMMDLR